jgi:hypothetical protein
MRRLFQVSAAALAVVLLSGAELPAADQGVAPLGGGAIAVTGPMALVCDNGRTYPIRPRAVSDFNEMVTGYISTGPRTVYHFRLVPMGTGYRYAGHGFWFDGLRGEATLNLHVAHTNCTVEYSCRVTAGGGKRNDKNDSGCYDASRARRNALRGAASCGASTIGIFPKRSRYAAGVTPIWRLNNPRKNATSSYPTALLTC